MVKYNLCPCSAFFLSSESTWKFYFCISKTQKISLWKHCAYWVHKELACPAVKSICDFLSFLFCKSILLKQAETSQVYQTYWLWNILIKIIESRVSWSSLRIHHKRKVLNLSLPRDCETMTNLFSILKLFYRYNLSSCFAWRTICDIIEKKIHLWIL